MRAPSLLDVTVGGLVVLGLGYRFYGRRLARQLALDDAAATPAVRKSDGQDFVPAGRTYLLGQHLSAITTAGAIIGPVLACEAFGWLPALLWIVLGSIFIGGVQDMSTLVASVRHDGCSIAEVIRRQVGDKAWRIVLVFIWVALVYLVLSYADVTLSALVGEAAVRGSSAETFNPGGAVALASALLILLAALTGLAMRYLRPPLALVTALLLPASLVAVWLGTRFSHVLVFGWRTWAVLILGYCLVEALLPVWALLQPRGYLGGILLLASVAAAVVGIVVGDFPVRQAAFKTWNGRGPTGGFLFPFLFVNLACGASSGFHALVSSGTTAKQITRESDCRPVGYGGMILQAAVALVALSTAMMLNRFRLASLTPGAAFGEGLAQYLSAVTGREHFLFGATFGAVVFTSVAFYTLDVVTRLGRYTLQELTGWSGRRGALAATALTVLVPLACLLFAEEHSSVAFWGLYGTSNQLLAALSLLGVSIWLHRSGRPIGSVLLALAFLALVSVSALVLQTFHAVRWAMLGGFQMDATLLNGILAFLLLAMAMAVAAQAWTAIRRSPPGAAPAAEAPP